MWFGGVGLFGLCVLFFFLLGGSACTKIPEHPFFLCVSFLNIYTSADLQKKKTWGKKCNCTICCIQTLFFLRLVMMDIYIWFLPSPSPNSGVCALKYFKEPWCSVWFDCNLTSPDSFYQWGGDYLYGSSEYKIARGNGTPHLYSII